MSGQADMMSLAQDDTERLSCLLEFHMEMARRQLDDLSLEFRTDCAEETRPLVFHGPCVGGGSAPTFTDSIHSTPSPPTFTYNGSLNPTVSLMVTLPRADVMQGAVKPQTALWPGTARTVTLG